MFGGLHIEMAAFKVLGEWQEAFGWTHALAQANVASSGTADSFLKTSRVTKTRRAYQVTACSLFILLHAAHSEYTLECIGDTALEFANWCETMSTEKPVSVWYLCWNFLCFYIYRIDEGDFWLYLASLTKLIPWVLALNHTKSLPSNIPTETKFQDGHFFFPQNTQRTLQIHVWCKQCGKLNILDKTCMNNLLKKDWSNVKRKCLIP